MTDRDGHQPLQDAIREQMVVPEPDESALVESLTGVIEIVDSSWQVVLDDDVYTRKPTDQICTYLLGKYAAALVSDGEAPLVASRRELLAVFPRRTVQKAAKHEWIDSWDDGMQIYPHVYGEVAESIAEEY